MSENEGEMAETEHSFYDEAKLYAQEAIGLCLHGKGEAWARIMSSDRTRHAANAVLRATLSEIKRIGAHALLEETIQQQRLLPPAPPGSPAYSADGKTIPHICSLVSSEK
jgi:hypothetical protein